MDIKMFILQKLYESKLVNKSEVGENIWIWNYVNKEKSVHSVVATNRKDSKFNAKGIKRFIKTVLVTEFLV